MSSPGSHICFVSLESLRLAMVLEDGEGRGGFSVVTQSDGVKSSVGM